MGKQQYLKYFWSSFDKYLGAKYFSFNFSHVCFTAGFKHFLHKDKNEKPFWKSGIHVMEHFGPPLIDKCYNHSYVYPCSSHFIHTLQLIFCPHKFTHNLAIFLTLLNKAKQRNYLDLSIDNIPYLRDLQHLP